MKTVTTLDVCNGEALSPDERRIAWNRAVPNTPRRVSQAKYVSQNYGKVRSSRDRSRMRGKAKKIDSDALTLLVSEFKDSVPTTGLHIAAINDFIAWIKKRNAA